MDRFFQLLHLGDSALPAGGYAFSSGLEGAYQLGLLQSAEALQEFACSALATAAYGEIPFVHSCYAESGDGALADMLHFYDAMVTAPAIRRASVAQGKNWLRLMADLYPEAGLVDLRRRFGCEQWPAHFTVVFGMAMKTAGFSLAETQRLYMFHTLRDRMSAAVRLGVVGPMEATRRQLRLYPYCDGLLAEVAGRPYARATRCAPQLDIAQSVHDYLYSRLFQS